MMYAYDVECFRNYFVAVFVDVEDYFKIRDNKATDEVNVKTFEKYILTAKRRVFHIGFGRNDMPDMIAFVNRGIILSGFNILDYDNILINACIANINRWKTIGAINIALYNLSKRIIANQNAKIFNDKKVTVYKHMRTFYKSVDVQKVFGLNKVFKSIKQTLINVGWYNIEDYEMPDITDAELMNMPYSHSERDLIAMNMLSHWDRYLDTSHLQGLGNYCLNDTNGVCEILYQKREEVMLRFDISNEYKVNVLSSSRSNIADRLFGKFYTQAAKISFDEYNKGRTERQYIDIAGCMPHNIQFTTDSLKKLYFDLVTTRIYNTKGGFSFNVTINETTYNVASGGLHSKDKPALFESTDDVDLIDADVTSYYPNIVRNYKIAPAHLDARIFIETTSGIIDERIEAKKNKLKTRADALKIVINVGVFGKMGFEDSPAYDPLAMVSVTIAGQMGLLLLIERLELNDLKVISANTDGIVTIVPKNRYDDYMKICNTWEKELNFGLEYTYYEKYVRTNVNNYMAIKQGDSPVKKRIKYKGVGFNPNLFKEELTKGYKNPIVAHAISNYFTDGIPVMETLKECNNIRDFCATQKPGNKFKLGLHRIINGKVNVLELTKDIRFYVSKGMKDLESGQILKNDTTLQEGEKGKYTNIVAGRNVTILNKIVDYDNFVDYKIDYGYYYNEARKIINAVEAKSTKPKIIKKNLGQYKMRFE